MTQKSIEISMKQIEVNLKKSQQMNQKRLIVDSFSSNSISEDQIQKFLNEIRYKKRMESELKGELDSKVRPISSSSLSHSSENDLSISSPSSSPPFNPLEGETLVKNENGNNQMKGEESSIGIPFSSSKEEEKHSNSFGKTRIDITAKIEPFVELVDIEYTKTKLTEGIQWDIDFNTPDGLPLTASVATPFTKNHSWKRHCSLSNRIQFSYSEDLKESSKISSSFRIESRVKEPKSMPQKQKRGWKRMNEATERARYLQREPDVTWFSPNESEFKESFSLKKEGLDRVERGENKGKYLINALEHPRLWDVEVVGPMDLSLTRSAKTKVNVYERERGKNPNRSLSPLSDIRIKENVGVNVKGVSQLKIIGPFDLKITKDFGKDGKSDFSRLEFASDSPVDVDGDLVTIIPFDPVQVDRIESDFIKFINSTHFSGNSQFGGSLRIETADSLFNVIKAVNKDYPNRNRAMQKESSLFPSPEEENEKGKWDIFQRINQLKVHSMTLIHVFFKTRQTGGSFHQWESTLTVDYLGNMKLTSLKENKFSKSSSLITIIPSVSVNNTVMALIQNFRPNATIQFID
eukprot:TRINITY_DN2629_c0_g2_i2.p1 TRINITY_DN2629_c0_g2~~TRINITY_DN2629_c0_g2_i2.p1  ORF type:complete len:643 (-),score=226.62 TRINITY_DN2629_c0_g2_i2:1746-3476(-)